MWCWRRAESPRPRAREALDRLCRGYWFPLYGYVRARNFSPHDAEDLTQEFFARFIASDALRTISEERGRFRAFLLASLNHFLANEWDRLRAQKRGGGQTPLSLDAATAEERLQLEPATDLTPERLYDRRWALTLLDTVLDCLGRRWPRRGRRQNSRRCAFSWATRRAQVLCRGRCADRQNGSGGAKGGPTPAPALPRIAARGSAAHTVGAPHEVENELRQLLAAFAR